MSCNPTCQTCLVSIGPVWALAIVVWHRNLFNISSVLSLVLPQPKGQRFAEGLLITEQEEY